MHCPITGWSYSWNDEVICTRLRQRQERQCLGEAFLEHDNKRCFPSSFQSHQSTFSASFLCELGRGAGFLQEHPPDQHGHHHRASFETIKSMNQHLCWDSSTESVRSSGWLTADCNIYAERQVGAQRNTEKEGLQEEGKFQKFTISSTLQTCRSHEAQSDPEANIASNISCGFRSVLTKLLEYKVTANAQGLGSKWSVVLHCVR